MNILNFNTDHWSWLDNHESMLADLESRDFDVEQLFDNLCNTNDNDGE